MTQTQTSNNPQPSPNQVAKVVRIRPGISSEKSLKEFLPEELNDATVDEVVRYFVNKTDTTRKYERLADSIKNEMAKEYGITVNGNGAKGNEKLAQYFTRKTTEDGVEYEEAVITVAANQEGGLEYSLR